MVFAATARPTKVAKGLAVGTRVLQFQARHGLIKPLSVSSSCVFSMSVDGWEGRRGGRGWGLRG